MKGILKEKTLSSILETEGPVYQWEMGVINSQEFVRRMKIELDKN